MMVQTILESVTFQIKNQYWAAITVRLTDQHDVYVNYLGDKAQMHTSHHASGQKHQKRGKGYIQWKDDSLTAQWKPMKELREKPTAILLREHVAVWGWEINKIPAVLPAVHGKKEMNIDISTLSHSAEAVLGLEISILGDDAQERSEIYGFPVVQKHRMSNGRIVAEIEAFFLEKG